jgi:hypothetical protein
MKFLEVQPESSEKLFVAKYSDLKYHSFAARHPVVENCSEQT